MPAFINLKEFLDAARERGRMDSEEFARIVFDPADRLEALAVKTSNASKAEKLAATQAYAQAAASILARALELHPDESLVFRWFNHEHLQDFGRMTPAEMISAGQSDVLFKYIESLDSGSTG